MAKWRLFKLAASLAALAAASGAALAQICDTTEFRSGPGQIYLEAETEILTNKNPQAALAKLQKLLAMTDLNCYEKGAAMRLGAAIKIESQDYKGAARDLQGLLDAGLIPQKDRLNTLFQISQLYLTADDRTSALRYYELWLGQGGQPTRDQSWTLASLYYQSGNPRKALEFAEKVFQKDGPNADRTVYDFLILLYEETGQLAKRAALLETLLERNPGERRLWEVIASDYFKGGDERKAFEMQKAMYFAGLLSTEDELMRIVNFYNRFDAPFEAAKMLEKEMNAGRIKPTFEKLELLANLYQVAREYKRAIPVIQRAAKERDTGAMYERLGRSHFELRSWEEAEKALTTALSKGGLKEPGFAWVLIGQSRYERKDRAGAREAFRKATEISDGRAAGRGWIDFMKSEDDAQYGLIVYEQQQALTTVQNEERRCKELAVLGEGAPASCATVAERVKAEQGKLAEIQRKRETS